MWATVHLLEGPLGVKCRLVTREEEKEIEFVRREVSVERRVAQNIFMPKLLLESRLLQRSGLGRIMMVC